MTNDDATADKSWKLKYCDWEVIAGDKMKMHNWLNMYMINNGITGGINWKGIPYNREIRQRDIKIVIVIDKDVRR